MIYDVLSSIAFLLLLRKKSLPFNIKIPLSPFAKGERQDFYAELSPLRA
jgi:hypothetical protein